VGQGGEHVVVEPAGVGAMMHLGVHAGHRAGQHQGLVGQVAAEVRQGAAAGRVRAVLRPEPLEPRLQDGQRAERSFVQELAHGQEVRVPRTPDIGIKIMQGWA